MVRTVFPNSRDGNPGNRMQSTRSRSTVRIYIPILSRVVALDDGAARDGAGAVQDRGGGQRLSCQVGGSIEVVARTSAQTGRAAVGAFASMGGGKKRASAPKSQVRSPPVPIENSLRDVQDETRLNFVVLWPITPLSLGLIEP